MSKDSNNFDVIGITELFGMAQGECSIQGYHPLEFATRNDSNKSRGGVGLYVKCKYKYKQRQDLSIFMPNIFESIFIEIIIDRKNIIVGTVYRPNSYPKADIDVFMHTMNELQHLLGCEHKEVYIMGDMNIDLLNFTSHKKTGEYLENILAQGFLPLITKPSIICSHSSTLIDHIYTNKTDLNAVSGIVITDVSDHLGVFSIIQLMHSNNENISRIKLSRSYSQANIATFKDKLGSIDYTPIFKEICPNRAYDIFIELYTQAYDYAFPLKKSKIPRKYLKRSPWLTKGLVQSSIKKIKIAEGKN